MKHFIFILTFACAWFSANAIAPTSRLYTADLSKITQKVAMPSPRHEKGIQMTQMRQLTQPISRETNPREFFKNHNVTPGDNRLSKRAPRRLSNDDILNNNYLDFRYVYSFNDDYTDLEPDDYFYRGGFGCYWTVYNDQLYCDGLIMNDYAGEFYYLPVNIDYNTCEVSVPTGYVIEDDTLEGVYNTSTRHKVDTVKYSIFVDSDWYLGNSDDFSDVQGTMYPDGSIEFNQDQAYVFAGYQVLNSYSRTGNSLSGYRYTLQSSDTTYFDEFYYNTQLLVSNATQEYDIVASNTSHWGNDAYMFQYDDSTVAVFNLFGLGMPYVIMNIYANGTMRFPLDQPIGEMGRYSRSQYQESYSTYNWDEARWWWPVATYWDEDLQDYIDTDDTEIIGNVDDTEISWDAMVYYITGIYSESEDQYYALSTYPLINNRLYFTDGSQFYFPESYSHLRGDVNNDGMVTLQDVVTLIDHLLIEDFDDSDAFNGDNADTNLDGTFSITDVVTLIDYVINGNWPYR